MTSANQKRASFWRFIVVGGGNTVAGVAIIFAARARGLGEVSANAAGYTIGLVLSFTLNRHWTFRHRGPALPLALKFLATMLLAWLTNLAMLLGLIRCGLPPALAQLCAVLPYTVVSYLGCKRWVFANR